MEAFNFYLSLLLLKPGANLNKSTLHEILRKDFVSLGLRVLVLASFISWDSRNTVIRTSCTLNYVFPSQCKPALIKNDIDYFPQFSDIPDIIVCVISS